MFIEHSIDMICHSDWIIDLGPEGGTKGGEIIVEGNPLKILNNQINHTMKFIRKAIDKI